MSLTVQPEKSSVDPKITQASPNVGYRKVDIDLGRQQEIESINDARQQPNGVANGDVPLTNGIGKENQKNDIETLGSEETGSKIENEVNGIATNQQTESDQFQRLPKPQQEILVLHGPRQRYRLEKAQDIPELKSYEEILVQVGKNLNPLESC